MARSLWRKTLVSSLAWAGLAWAQQPQTDALRSVPTSPAMANTARTLTVQEPGKPAQKCKVVKTWKTTSGTSAYQVQALGTGEIMTIVESGPTTTLPGSAPNTRMKATATRIYHWGPGQTPPEGTPMPSDTAVRAVAMQEPAPMLAPAPAPLQKVVPVASTDSGCTPCQTVTRTVVAAPSPCDTPCTPCQDTGTKPVVIATSPYAPRMDLGAKSVVVATTPCETPCTPCQDNAARPVVATPVQANPNQVRPGFFARLFHRDDVAVVSTTPQVAPPTSADRYNTISEYDSLQSQKSKATVVKSAPPTDGDQKKAADAGQKPADDKKTTATVKAQVTPPPASDWRQSWGKADDHKSTATPADNKTAALPVLPQADSKKPDPLQAPESFARSPWDAPKPVKQDAVKPPVLAPVTVPNAAPQMAIGAGSVLGAGAAGGVHYIPVPMVAMPDMTRPPMPPTPQIPRAPQPVVPQNDGNAFVSQQNRALTPDPTTYDQGLVNAFTSMPSQEQVAHATNAFNSPDAGSMASMLSNQARQAGPNMNQRSPYGMMAQGIPAQMPMTGVPGVLPVGYQVSGTAQQSALAAYNVQQMQTTLHDSMYPSQREWAADSMAAVDWRANPEVVQALLTAAKDDPASAVRAACVRCLSKMNVNTVPVVTTLQGMKYDSDPRVQKAVEDALVALAPKGMTR